MQRNKTGDGRFFHPNKGGKFGLRGQCIPCHRVAVREAIKKPEIMQRSEEIFGFTKDDLRRHIEAQFTDGMNWDALARGEIHIDHRTPVSSFSTHEPGTPEFKACWALTNLRPLWAIDNQRKGNRLDVAT